MSWFDDFTSQAERALQATVAKIDETLDIKEEPGTILSPSSGKSKQELLKENRSGARVDAVQTRLSTTKRSSQAKNGSPEGADGSKAAEPKRSSTDDFFSMFGASISPTRDNTLSPPSKTGNQGGAAAAASADRSAASKTKRASKRKSSGARRQGSNGARNGASSPQGSDGSGAGKSGGGSNDAARTSQTDSKDKNGTSRTASVSPSSAPAPGTAESPRAASSGAEKNADDDDTDATLGVADGADTMSSASGTDATPAQDNNTAPSQSAVPKANALSADDTVNNKAPAGANDATGSPARPSTDTVPSSTRSEPDDAGNAAVDSNDTDKGADRQEEVTSTEQPSVRAVDAKDSQAQEKDGGSEGGAGDGGGAGAGASREAPTGDSAAGTTESSAAVGNPDANASPPPVVAPPPTKEEIADLDDVAATYATKLAHVSMVLAAREEKLVQLSAELADKNETHHVLHAQIEQLESQLQDNFTGRLEQLTAEFTERLGQTEERFKETARERDELRKQLQTATARFTERIGQTDKLSGEVLAEKDAKIEGLMNEGQKLQKKLHESGLRNKKLQGKVKEGDAALAALTTRMDAAQERIAALEKELATKAAKEEKYKATANQVTAVQDQQSKELTKTKKEVKQLTDKNESLQAALDTAFKAKALLEKQLAEETVKATSAMSAAESAAAASKATELKRKEEEFERVKTDLHAEIADLRATLTRQQGQADRRETNLQQEIADLNERLRNSEQREQQMTESMAQSTKPLVRQIDMLRAQLAEQTASADVAEQSLITRIDEQAVALQGAEERERLATDKLNEERLRTAGFEEKLGSLRKSKIDLQTKLEKQMEHVEELELELHKVREEKKALAATFDGAREEWRVERLKLKALTADTLKTREDEWQRERDALQRQLKDMSSSSVARPSRGGAGSAAGAQTLSANGVGDATDAGRRSASPRSMAGGGGGGGGTVSGNMERLNTDLSHKEEALMAARRQLEELSKSRSAIADELVVLVAKNEELSSKCAELPKVQADLAEAERKLDQVMVMYGEKKEEAAELRLDLQDFRQLYQMQTQQLCGQIEQLSAQLASKGDAPS
eukprot:m.186682 g.186682  ORF g.186682 m.186682 type:complete len:1085 (+) comp16856_c0_seq1:76-3330(+)